MLGLRLSSRKRKKLRIVVSLRNLLLVGYLIKLIGRLEMKMKEKRMAEAEAI
jgi:hypothetical protein